MTQISANWTKHLLLIKTKKMKIFITTLAMLFSIITYAQEIDVEIEDDEEMEVEMEDEMDPSEMYKDLKHPEDIADAVTDGLKDPREKTEAIFKWVAGNIAYDIKMYDDFKTGERDKKKGKRIKRSEMEEHNADKVERALKKKKGICEDYALVFKAICDEANIETKLIKGWIRNDPSKLRSTGAKHVWNVVKIDGEWLHCDATYASGFLNNYDEYVFDYEGESYFFPNPEQMQYTHFPKDTTYKLTPVALTKDQFKKRPLVGKGFFTNKITKLDPNEVAISVKRGENITIAFESEEKLTEVTCYRPKTDEYIIVKHVQVGNRNNVIIKTKDFKSGPIHILANKELIAAYKLAVVK